MCQEGVSCGERFLNDSNLQLQVLMLNRFIELSLDCSIGMQSNSIVHARERISLSSGWVLGGVAVSLPLKLPGQIQT